MRIGMLCLCQKVVTVDIAVLLRTSRRSCSTWIHHAWSFALDLNAIEYQSQIVLFCSGLSSKFGGCECPLMSITDSCRSFAMSVSKLVRQGVSVKIIIIIIIESNSQKGFKSSGRSRTLQSHQIRRRSSRLGGFQLALDLFLLFTVIFFM